MSAVTVGVISDTHGLLRPQALEILRGSQLIIHAGDVGEPDIISELARLAPVHAIRGNVDIAPWAESLPETDVIDVAGLHIYVVHDIKKLDLNPSSAGFAAVISGHSHKPDKTTRGGVLYFNPGSAGPKRFNLPITVGRLSVRNETISGEIIPLHVG